eukprot:TRINITY_DN20761_c0_g1_i1.p1 TRINITY_DN20761_c0_g1~~TRINITY_DN20761_c0_g1_i1.p1  ORF type:complete len:312 (+),score=53.67 TRINITY_DN20761_c0_g1_i1:717-1652(+)
MDDDEGNHHTTQNQNNQQQPHDQSTQQQQPNAPPPLPPAHDTHHEPKAPRTSALRSALQKALESKPKATPTAASKNSTTGNTTTPTMCDASAETDNKPETAPTPNTEKEIIVLDRYLRYSDGGLTELRSEVMVCNAMMGVTIGIVQNSKDKEKIFKKAHTQLKAVVVDLLTQNTNTTHQSDRDSTPTMKPGEEWPLSDLDIIRIAPHQRNSVIKSLQDLIISYDMMPIFRRSTMVTVMEVINNTHWLIKMARFCYHTGKIAISRTPKKAQNFTFDQSTSTYKAASSNPPTPTNRSVCSASPCPPSPPPVHL